MAQDYILHFQPEIPQIMIAQEGSNGQIGIIKVIKGKESLDIINYLTRTNNV